MLMVFLHVFLAMALLQLLDGGFLGNRNIGCICTNMISDRMYDKISKLTRQVLWYILVARNRRIPSRPNYFENQAMPFGPRDADPLILDADFTSSRGLQESRGIRMQRKEDFNNIVEAFSYF